LNQLTVGDVVQAFQDFMTQSQQAQQAAAKLTPDQINQIQDLQSQLDAGKITPQDFETQVQAIAGDAAPLFAFGGARAFGSPFGHRMGTDLATLLNLTDDQKTQAQNIFTSAHTDIENLRTDANNKILAVLTPEQQN